LDCRRFYTIDGWDEIIYFGEEVRNPDATFRARFSVALPYHGNLFADQRRCAVCASHVGKSQAILSCSARLPNGSSVTMATPLFAASMIIFAVELPQRQSTFLFAHAVCDELRPIILSQLYAVNPGGTPLFHTAAGTIVGVLFVLGCSKSWIASCRFSSWPTYAHGMLRVVLRKKEPQMERPYRAWGYPWTRELRCLHRCYF